MNKVIQVGLSSYGMSGMVFHGPTLKVNPKFHIKYILERSKSLSAEPYPGAIIVRSYDEILNDPTIDLVVVNTPDQLHYEMTKAALVAGKHVVVEKPFTQTVEEANDLISIAKSNNLMLTVYQNRRWDGDFLTVKKLIEDSVLGRLVEFESHFDRYRNSITQDTWKEEEGGNNGVLFNLGAHMVDQALHLFGLPVSVTAHLQKLREGSKVPDYYDIRLQYDGFAAILKSSYLVREQGPRYSLHGTLGSFQKYGLDPQEAALKAGSLPEDGDWGTEPESEWGMLHTELEGAVVRKKIETVAGNYSAFYELVYMAIVLKQPPPVAPEDALMTQQILQLCIQSHEEKKTMFL